MSRDKKEFAIVLVRKLEDAIIGSVYRISQNFARGHKLFDGAVKDVNGPLLNQNAEQLKGWKKHFIMVVNRIAYGEVPALVDEVTCIYGLFLQTEHPNPVKPMSLTVFMQFFNLFIATCSFTADLLLPLVQKSCKYETFLRGWKEGMIAKIPQKCTHFECNMKRRK